MTPKKVILLQNALALRLQGKRIDLKTCANAIIDDWELERLEAVADRVEKDYEQSLKTAPAKKGPRKEK